MKNSLPSAMCLAATSLLVGACASSTARSVETNVAKVLISSEQENQLGLQFKGELDTKQGIVYMADPTVVNYVRGVADKVIALGKKDRPEVAWQVFVIDDRKTVNAFATPGGYLYVYRGLLELAQNEAELAGVMAHEAGHVVARHSARSMVASYGLDAVAAMALGNNPGMVSQLASNVAAKGLLLAHTREDETEADEFGARYSSGAGYDPHGLVTFFQRLKEKSGGDATGLLAYLSDHPATQQRIDHVNAYVTQHGLGGAELGIGTYATMRQRLATLPSATPGAAAPPASAPPGAAPPTAPPPSARPPSVAPPSVPPPSIAPPK